MSWGCPFCWSQGGTQKLTWTQYQHVIYHLRAKAGFLGPLRNRKGTHGICPFWGSLGHSTPRRCKHTHVGWRGNPALLARNCSPKLDTSLLHDGRDGVGSSSSVTRAAWEHLEKKIPRKDIFQWIRIGEGRFLPPATGKRDQNPTGADTARRQWEYWSHKFWGWGPQNWQKVHIQPQFFPPGGGPRGEEFSITGPRSCRLPLPSAQNFHFWGWGGTHGDEPMKLGSKARVLAGFLGFEVGMPNDAY